jgi:diguanylate cyclase (GGDEF)-like protein/PAS domain S-box-containing protein
VSGLRRSRVSALHQALSRVMSAAHAKALLARIRWPSPTQDLSDARLAADYRRLLHIFNKLPHALSVFDEDGNFVLWNDKYTELFPDIGGDVARGKNVEEALRGRVYRGFYAEAVGREEEWLAERRNQLKHLPLNQDRQLGGGRWINTDIRAGADGLRICTYTDITELKGKEASFRLLFESNPVPVWVYDKDSFRFLAANDAFIDFLRYSRDELLGMTIFEIVPEEHHARLREIAGKAEGQVNPGFTWQLIRADGGRAEVDAYARTLNYEGRPARMVATIDISENIRASRELNRAESFLNAVVENAPVPIVVKDVTEFRYVLVNRAAEAFLGTPREKVLGKTPFEVFPIESATQIVERDRESLRSNGLTVFSEHQVQTSGNGLRLSNSTRIPIFNANNELTHILILIEDVTERRRDEARIRHLAMNDTLTGLPNRAAFNERMAQAIERGLQSREPFSVICIDVDRFKEVNDVYGHAVGDDLLRGVAERLVAASDGHFLSRPGGDELTVIAEGTPLRVVQDLADRLLRSTDEEFEIQGHTLKVGLSLGAAMFPENGEDPATLLANADAALYRSKSEGRGTVRFFKAAMDQQLREKRALLRDLRSALTRHELSLQYQPQATVDGEIVGFEALARWWNPVRGDVSPGVFIGLAEDGGLIVEMGEWILREACREAASWSIPLQVSVNLSPLQVAHSDLTRMVANTLVQTGLNPDRLTLEITESALIGNMSSAISIIQRIKSLGVKVAMDDFGKGFSSLSLLHSMPLDKIKIDKEFIANIDRAQSAAVIRAVIGLAHDLGLPVLAEGVETERQRAFLAKEGCDEIQGFLVGYPSSMDIYAVETGDTRASGSLSKEAVLG